jgi:hypothetical protein
VSTARSRITASRFRRPWKKRSGLRILAWVAGIAVVITAVVVTVSVWVSGEDEPGSETAAGLAPVFDAMKAPPRADAAPTAPEVEVVEVKILSRPAGATIYEGGRYIGVTPTTYTTTKRDKDVELIAELDGHNDARLIVNPYVDTEVTVRLKKPKKGTKVKKIRRVPRTGADKPPDKKAGKPGDSGKGDDSAGGDLIGNPYDDP